MLAPDKKTESALLALRTRHGRKKSNLCICEGLRACEELLKRAPRLLIQGVVRDDFKADHLDLTHFRVASHQWFERYAPTQNSQGIIILAERPTFEASQQVSDPFVLALDQVNDPGNLGTILRSLSAAGLSELWLTRGSVDPFSDKAIRSGMGMQFSMNIRYFENLQEMFDTAPSLGVTGKMWLTTPHQGPSLYQVDSLFERSIIVMGGEANGITNPPENPNWVSLPMPGDEESLNVAQCATIFVFEYVRRITI